MKRISIIVAALTFLLPGIWPAAAAAPTEIVLYASEASLKAGNWTVVADSSAAGGARIWNPDAGAAKLANPLALPVDYFEVRFNADAGTAYRLWIRGKAQNDSPFDDSIFVQFSGSVDSNGAAVFRIGTDSATTINLEDCLGCGLSGWGWQDNGWGAGVLGPLIYFQASGPQTIRVQTREDGLSLDQIVLSPQAYLNTSPGALKNDSTILPKTVPAGGMPLLGHVIFVVEENHSYENVVSNTAMPYLNALANRYGLAMNYYANAHPSIGNYFMLTTGALITSDDQFSGSVTVDNIVRELNAAGKTWKAYCESLPAVGYTGGDQYPYIKHHDPFAYLSDVTGNASQAQSLVPFSQFASDLANGRLPAYSFVVPNNRDNGHDCPDGSSNCADVDKLTAIDNWLRSNIEPLLSSAAFQQDGLLVVLFDESVTSDTTSGGGHIAVVVASPRSKPGFRSTTLYQHQNALKTAAEALGLTSFPGAAATAGDMAEFFDTSTSPTPSVSSISPASGPATGATSVTITGSGFSPFATVFLGGSPATNVIVKDSGTITATTPAHSAGAVDVVVSNTNGISGTRSAGFTYTVSGETVLLADDFDDNSLDATKWIAGNLFSGFTDSATPAVERNQRFEIGPLLANTSGSHYNGIRSAGRYDFTGAYCYVRLVQAAASNTTADAMLTIGVDVDNYYRIYVEGTSLTIQKKTGGAKSTLLTLPFDSINHQFVRLRHDAVRGDVVFETAPNASNQPGSWTERYREPWNTGSVVLTSILFELKAGTFTAETAQPGIVVFDAFRAARQ